MSISSPPQDQTFNASQISRRNVLAGSGLFAMGVVGCETSRETEASFQVAGPSMAPTLWGPSVQFACTACGVPIRVDAERWLAIELRIASLGKRGGSVPRCWHCGTLVDQESAFSLTRIQPDVVTAVASPARQIQCRLDTGEKPLVLVKCDDRLHVKRLLAGPGQLVTADENGRMLVDGDTITVPDSPRLPIDLDEKRRGDIASRWSSRNDSWHRNQQGIWSSVVDSVKVGPGLVWLIYQHRNVYRGNVVSGLLDDCPSNLGMDRQLHPVDEIGLSLVVQPRLGKSADSSNPPSPRRVHAMAWSERGIQTATQSLPAQVNEAAVNIEFTPQAFREGNAITDSGRHFETLPALSRTSPIAIGLNLETVAVARKLQIWRPVSWRAAALSRWELATDEWFVAGDNVPVSVDSRTWGPVRTDQIVGVCKPIDRRVALIQRT